VRVVAYRDQVRIVLVLIGVLLAVSACAREKQPVVVPQVPQFSTGASASGNVAEGRPVPKTCADLVSSEDIGTVLGTLIGDGRPVVGVPQPSIGRTARLDCYYGLSGNRPVSTATVWIGLATYTDRQHAQDRLTDTVSTERDAGSQINEVPVGDGDGVLMRGRTWMLVATRGKTTAVVSIQRNLVREDRAGAMLGQLADKALTPSAATGG
jgi:hypothetical protein